MDVTLPSRSKRFRVGKEIGGAVYVHRAYEAVLPREALHRAEAALPPGFEYHVVKYAVAEGVFSFVHCPQFDSAPEPIVGEIVTVRPDGAARRRAQPLDPEIYHHKWLFVRDDYPGFDVEASKARSRAWLRLEGVDRRRIGRKSYWEREVAAHLAG